MIYITPTKYLLSDESRNYAIDFAVNSIANEKGVENLVNKITKNMNIIRTPEQNLRVQFEHRISERADRSGSAYLFAKTFPEGHHLSRMAVKMGFNCPTDVERQYRNSEDKNIFSRLKTAIDDYNTKNNKKFRLHPKMASDLVFVGYMEQPIHSIKLIDIESQKERLAKQINLYLKHKITEAAKELNPKFNMEKVIEKENVKKRSTFFSDQLMY